MELADSIAFELHERWRKNRIKAGERYESKWETIKDKNFLEELDKEDLPPYVKKIGYVYKIDVANTCYTMLSPDLQNEKKEAAKVVAKIIESKANLTREEIGNIIHNEWLKRNNWAKGGKLDVPFAKLPKIEQDKYLEQYYIGKKMDEAELYDERMGQLEICANFLRRAKREGKNIKYKFNDAILYSEFDDLDSCYLKVCGLTEKQYQISLKKIFSELNERKKQSKISRWKKRGETLIYPGKKKKWYKTVENCAKDSYDGAYLDNVLDIMESLEKSEDVQDAINILNDAGHSANSEAIVLDIVTSFSKRGPEFYRAKNQGNLDQKTERYLNQIAHENKILSHDNGKGLGD